MSKAFTRENETSDDLDDEIEDALPLPAGAKNYMTPHGWRRMRDELAHLVKVDRPQVTSVVSWAASNGDRSENGDYLYGKKRLREIDRRIRYLTKRLENAEVVDPATREESEQVFFGATVVYSTAEGGRTMVRIVGLDETDLGRGYISWISPVARALIKACDGDIVTLVTPGGRQALEILEVRYEDIPMEPFVAPTSLWAPNVR
jgi:transcription elongation factor GreB